MGLLRGLDGNLLVFGSFSMSDTVSGTTRSLPPLVRIFGFDPNRVEALAPEHAGGQFQVSTRTLRGRNYRLEATDKLDGGSWETVNTVSGDGTARILSDLNASKAQRFYRLRAE